MACSAGPTKIFSDQFHTILNMTMENKRKYNLPVGQGSRGPYTKGVPEAPVPEYIQLPDGRQFLTEKLLASRTRPIHHNLLKLTKGEPTNYSGVGRPVKYTAEDRAWQAEATYQDIMQRYGMSKSVAKSVKSYARNLQRQLKGDNPEDSVIYDYTKKDQ
jgi:hypothetical protein